MSSVEAVQHAPCQCAETHSPRRVVLTGGPGAGKTAFLELVRRSFCAHVRVLPESAGVVFGGGFPRHDEGACRRAAQRAIFHVQRQLENCAEAHNPAVVLCDRGTVDGIAYWPPGDAGFYADLLTTSEEELRRYDAVIHLRTPNPQQGYNRQNPLRTESAVVAATLDERILEAWKAHPRRFVVESSPSFLDKVTRAMDLLAAEVPVCCRGHAPVPVASSPR